VRDKFLETCDGYEVADIQRVENMALWCLFTQMKVNMDRRTAGPSGSAGTPLGSNEMSLFHGTGRETAMKIVQQGFDRGFTETHAFGKGVYFAANSLYTCNDKFSRPDPTTRDKYIFLARVLVGDFCKGHKEDKAPSKPRPGGANDHDLCDSTVDKETKPQIFVTYRDNQCYPEYLLTVRKCKP